MESGIISLCKCEPEPLINDESGLCGRCHGKIINRPKIRKTKQKRQLIFMYLEDAEQNELAGVSNVLNQLFPKIQFVISGHKFETISKNELKMILRNMDA